MRSDAGDALHGCNPLQLLESMQMKLAQRSQARQAAQTCVSARLSRPASAAHPRRHGRPPTVCLSFASAYIVVGSADGSPMP